MHRRLVGGLVAATVAALTVTADLPARAFAPIDLEAQAPASFLFRTPGDAVYCGWTVSGYGFVCATPNDGFFIRLRRIATEHPVVDKGYDARFKGLRDHGVRLLPFGRTFYSSDAEVMVCDSRSMGLTCKHWGGLSFWLGRFRGYRIFLQEPGHRPAFTHSCVRATASAAASSWTHSRRRTPCSSAGVQRTERWCGSRTTMRVTAATTT